MKRMKFVGLDVHAETIAGQRDRLESTTTVMWTLSEVTGQGQEQGVMVTAVSCGLLGFMWAIGIKVETAQKASLQQAA